MRAGTSQLKRCQGLDNEHHSDFQLTTILPLDSDEVAAFQLTRSSQLDNVV
jgi:hypothetical protein